MRFSAPLVALALTVLGGAQQLQAQDRRPLDSTQNPPILHRTEAHFGSSPFAPPKATDTNFFVDQGSGLDTGCTYRSGGPLVFSIEITRVIGDREKLLENQLLEPTAALRMPAFDVDFDATVVGINPERDRVYFNGHPVNETFLTGANNTWKLNEFRVPIQWVNFATAATNSGPPTAGLNEIRIDIDTANTTEAWCTSIDWAALSFQVARPAVLVHGIFSNGNQAWGSLWRPRLEQLGLPFSNDLNMGILDSIESNAGKIGVEVAKAKTRWGVEKVNLICHSKGGLDARNYVETNSDVAQVIQIGTPNAGSPWADVIRAGLLALQARTRFPIAFLSDLTLPAGRQLTTGSMATYNLFHSHNSAVTYTALAGDYDPDCSLLTGCPQPVWALLSLVAGQGDGVVPITSVHALPYTGNLFFESRGSDLDAVHTRLTETLGVYTRLRDRTGDRQRARVESPSASLSRTSTEGGMIGAAESQSFSLPFEAGGPAFVSLLFSSADLSLTLTSPSGVRYDAASVVGRPDVSHQVTEMLGNVLEVYQLADAEAGVWRADVTAVRVDTPAGRVGFAVHAWFADSPIQFSAATSPKVVATGQELSLNATLLRAGAPLRNAEVSAVVGRPDGTLTEVSLHDDGVGGDSLAGDGVYSAVLTPDQAGLYQVSFAARGTAASRPQQFSREAFAVAAVSDGGAQLTGVYGSRGVDTDGNGLFNQLAIEVGLNVGSAGSYRLLGVLTDAEGNRHEGSFFGPLTTGGQMVPLLFDGSAIYALGVDGPYTLSEIRLAKEGEVGALPLEIRTPVWVTAPFGFREFEHSPISLAGTGSAVGVDTDGNGLFDRLDVRLDLDLDSADSYSWSARLIDPQGREVGFASGSGPLGLGRQSILLPYSGQTIGQTGYDGPYTVADLLIFSSNDSLIADRAFETEPFQARQFEGYISDTSPPSLQVELRPGFLFPPEHQLIAIQATVTVTDDKDANPTVRLVAIVSSEADAGLDPRDLPNDVQEAALGTDDRAFLLRSERFAAVRSYRVTYEARDFAGNTATRTATLLVKKPK